MKQRRLIVLGVLVVAVAAGLVWWFTRPRRPAGELVLHGNIDIRQVELPFNNSQRIAEVLVEEGDQIRRGQVLARLDTTRLELQVAESEAQLAAQRQILGRLQRGSRPEEMAQSTAQAEAQHQVVERLRNGSRPEEIAQARANVESATADSANARQNYERVRSLIEKKAVSQDEFDDAKARFEMAQAKLAVNQKSLELALAGPRREEIAEAEARFTAMQKAMELTVAGPRQEEIDEAAARLKASEAQLAFLRQVLKEAQLVAPMDGVVRSRIMEPGEMTTPQQPVLSIAVTDPKWVRAYVTETELGRVQPGMPASVAVDSFPKQAFKGWIGFISPVAEFTPKIVQTEDLRTSLVYEVRVFVNDPKDVLRLGMPATVRLESTENKPEQTPVAVNAGPNEDSPAESER